MGTFSSTMDEVVKTKLKRKSSKTETSQFENLGKRKRIRSQKLKNFITDDYNTDITKEQLNSESFEFIKGQRCPFCDKIKFAKMKSHISGHVLGNIETVRNLEMLEYFEEKIGYNDATIDEIMEEIDFEEAFDKAGKIEENMECIEASNEGYV